MDDPVNTLSMLLDAKQSALLAGMHVSMPGQLVAYDRAKQKASVQPLVMRGYVGLDGERATELLPIVHGVPVEFPGGGDCYLAFPLKKGMTCRLAMTSVALGRWLARGGVVDPSDDRRLALTDSVCVIGLRDFAHAIVGLPDNAVVLAAPTGTEIRIGGNASNQKAIKGDAWLSAFNTLISAIATAISANIAGGGAGAATAIETARGVFEAAASTYLSSKVKLD